MTLIAEVSGFTTEASIKTRVTLSWWALTILLVRCFIVVCVTGCLLLFGLGDHHLSPQFGCSFSERLANLFVRSLFPNLNPCKPAILISLPFDEPYALLLKLLQECHCNFGLFGSGRTKVFHLVLLDDLLELQIPRMNTSWSTTTTDHVLGLQSQT